MHRRKLRGIEYKSGKLAQAQKFQPFPPPTRMFVSEETMYSRRSRGIRKVGRNCDGKSLHFHGTERYNNLKENSKFNVLFRCDRRKIYVIYFSCRTRSVWKRELRRSVCCFKKKRPIAECNALTKSNIQLARNDFSLLKYATIARTLTLKNKEFGNKLSFLNNSSILSPNGQNPVHGFTLEDGTWRVHILP